MKRTLVAVLVIAVIVLAGCLEMIYRKPLSESEAEEMTLDAMADMSATLDDLERRNGINQITMSVDDPEGMSGSLELSYTWGEGDMVRVDVDAEIDTRDLMSSMALDEAGHGEGNDTTPADGNETADGGDGTTDGNGTVDGNGTTDGDETVDDGMENLFGDIPERFTIQVTIYCTPDRVVEVFQGQAAEHRARSDCLPDDEAGMDDMDVAPIDDLQIASVSVDRWEVDAVLVDSDGQESTLHLDQRGRITAANITDPEGAVVTLTAEYGPLSTFEVPEPEARVPADVEMEEEEIDPESFSGRRYTITSADVAAPLSEFEVRAAKGWGPGAEQVAVWPMDAEAQDQQANLTFAFHDADEDGRLSIGDIFTISAAEGTIFLGYDVYIYDVWADAPVGESPLEMPGPATPLLALGLLGAVVALVRRWG